MLKASSSKITPPSHPRDMLSRLESLSPSQEPSSSVSWLAARDAATTPGILACPRAAPNPAAAPSSDRARARDAASVREMDLE